MCRRHRRAARCEVSRWKPKQWRTPKTRWTRDHLALPPRPATAEGLTRILKALYPQAGTSRLAHPKWADVARKFGWMSLSQYLNLPDSEKVRVPSLYETMMKSSAIWSLLPRSR